MARFQGKRVSKTWDWVLSGYVRETNNPIRLNQGRRTMAEQRVFRNAYERYLRGGPWAPLAAVPSNDAPHIWAGRENHALDVDAYMNGENRLQAWLARHGVNAVNNVPGESWHMQTYDEAALKRLARKLGPPRKRDRLLAEIARLRKFVRKHGNDWGRFPRRRRRADAIKAWLARHKRG